ncbi:hypothetical protein ACTMTJ_03010 [Phytohabitans sp. LJ34]|uniref:hypothetical protein n=1 Tax=Phytohabitans sp. LJ34 TaxID=3452217 RepID=UPI003F89ADC7
MPITEPGSIDDLVADAASAGYVVTKRMVRDWSEVGLLAYPTKRSAGKGHGSRPALYPANQRELFLTLLAKRAEASRTGGVRSLARVPVWLWLYWGDEYVALPQARRAFMTWLGDPRATKERARATAREMLRQLDHPNATRQARRELLAVLTDIGYTGRLDEERLERAVRDVFEPGHQGIRRAVGHPEAPITTDAMLRLAQARMTAVRWLSEGKVSDEAFLQARLAHRVHFADYAASQPRYAATAPEHLRDLYEPVTEQNTFNDCCLHLLTVIGLEILFPVR